MVRTLENVKYETYFVFGTLYIHIRACLIHKNVYTVLSSHFISKICLAFCFVVTKYTQQGIYLSSIFIEQAILSRESFAFCNYPKWKTAINVPVCTQATLSWAQLINSYQKHYQKRSDWCAAGKETDVPHLCKHSRDINIWIKWFFKCWGLMSVCSGCVCHRC